MNSKLYVGNLSFKTTEDDLNDLFSTHGKVVSARIVMDKETGRSKGFAFVEMETEDAAQAAIDSLGGKDFQTRSLKVNIAKPKPEGGGGGYGGGRSGGGGGGGRDRDRDSGDRPRRPRY